jgi:Domain of unknown function (DUF397)
MERVGAARTRSAVDSAEAARGAGFAWAAFRKSSYSSYNGACVEVAGLPGGLVGVRDSRDASRGRVLVVGAAAWAALVAGVKTDGLGLSP